MQLPPSFPSSDPTLSALLFPSATPLANAGANSPAASTVLAGAATGDFANVFAAVSSPSAVPNAPVPATVSPRDGVAVSAATALPAGVATELTTETAASAEPSEASPTHSAIRSTKSTRTGARVGGEKVRFETDEERASDDMQPAALNPTALLEPLLYATPPLSAELMPLRLEEAASAEMLEEGSETEISDENQEPADAPFASFGDAETSSGFADEAAGNPSPISSRTPRAWIDAAAGSHTSPRANAETTRVAQDLGSGSTFPQTNAPSRAASAFGTTVVPPTSATPDQAAITASETAESVRGVPVPSDLAANETIVETPRQASSSAVPLPLNASIAAAATREANFAAQGPGEISDEARGRARAEKSFVGAKDKELTSRESALGIGVANSASVMFQPSAPTQFAPAHPAIEYAVASTSALDASRDMAHELAPVMAESVSSAHEAVEVVLHAVDRVADREQVAVKLEFSVGGADLEVRVEMRDDEVRATFRTESPELQAALAQEWHSSTSSANERGLRLAPAIFANDSAATGGSSGDASSQQQGRNSSRSDEGSPSFAALTRAASFGASSSSSSSTPGLPSSRPLAPAGTAQRLHLIA